MQIVMPSIKWCQKHMHQQEVVMEFIGVLYPTPIHRRKQSSHSCHEASESPPPHAITIDPEWLWHHHCFPEISSKHFQRSWCSAQPAKCSHSEVVAPEQRLGSASNKAKPQAKPQAMASQDIWSASTDRHYLRKKSWSRSSHLAESSPCLST